MWEEDDLYEIAHALTPRAGHGPVWKQKCLEVGVKPERCYKGDKTPQTKYISPLVENVERISKDPD